MRLRLTHRGKRVCLRLSGRPGEVADMLVSMGEGVLASRHSPPSPERKLSRARVRVGEGKT